MAIINRLILFTVVLSALPVNAEVFKCQSKTGKVVYQSEPCAPSARKQQVLEIQQMTPEQSEEAHAKLRNWRERQAAEEAKQADAEKEQRFERDRREALELQRRSVRAQEQQAIAAQRQPPARPYGYVPYYPYYPYSYQRPGTGYPGYPRPYSPHQYHPDDHGLQAPYPSWSQNPPLSPYPGQQLPPPRAAEPPGPSSSFSAPYKPHPRPDSNIPGAGR